MQNLVGHIHVFPCLEPLYLSGAVFQRLGQQRQVTGGPDFDQRKGQGRDRPPSAEPGVNVIKLFSFVADDEAK
jgi:hypothetical protein